MKTSSTLKKHSKIFCYLTFLLIFTFTNCNQSDDIEQPPPIIGGNSTTNGPLSDTRWVAFAAHVYSGETAGDWGMDPTNQISINLNTTTFTGDFFDIFNGTYPSYYSENNPNFVMPTSPRVFVIINSNTTIEVIQGGHADLGTIVWIRTSTPQGDRVDVYFRSADKS